MYVWNDKIWKNQIHSFLQLRGFYLHKIPFTPYISLVPFLHLHINRSSVYVIFSKKLLYNSIYVIFHLGGFSKETKSAQTEERV